jgi:hypothetical protein
VLAVAAPFPVGCDGVSPQLTYSAGLDHLLPSASRAWLLLPGEWTKCNEQLRSTRPAQTAVAALGCSRRCSRLLCWGCESRRHVPGRPRAARRCSARLRGPPGVVRAGCIGRRLLLRRRGWRRASRSLTLAGGVTVRPRLSVSIQQDFRPRRRLWPGSWSSRGDRMRLPVWSLGRRAIGLILCSARPPTASDRSTFFSSERLGRDGWRGTAASGWVRIWA